MCVSLPSATGRVAVAGAPQTRDGVSYDPGVAIVGGALLDEGYRIQLGTAGWFDAEQGRAHRAINRIWPQFLGTTPAGIARALSVHSRGWPVAMLVGRFIPRHWVLLVGFRCYEPSTGAIAQVAADVIRRARLTGVGFGRPFAFVLPSRPV